MSGPSARLVDVSYRGLKLAQRVPLNELPEGAAFLEHEAPLPVGARVHVLADGAPSVEAQVVGVVENEAGGKATPGMRLQWLQAPPVLAGAPGPSSAAADPPPAAGSPVPVADTASGPAMPPPPQDLARGRARGASQGDVASTSEAAATDGPQVDAAAPASEPVPHGEEPGAQPAEAAVSTATGGNGAIVAEAGAAPTATADTGSPAATASEDDDTSGHGHPTNGKSRKRRPPRKKTSGGRA